MADKYQNKEFCQILRGEGVEGGSEDYPEMKRVSGNVNEVDGSSWGGFPLSADWRRPALDPSSPPPTYLTGPKCDDKDDDKDNKDDKDDKDDDKDNKDDKDKYKDKMKSW